jgi:trans-aconitate 2-methyltransferase
MITTAHAAAGPSASGPWFDGFVAPFVHVDPDHFRDLAASADLRVTDLVVVSDEVDAYEPIAGRPGLFRFTQMRAELRR